jgi:hypothetical protein
MKKLWIALLVALLAAPALARHVTHKIPLADLLALGNYQADGSIKFYLKQATTPKVIQTLGEGASTRTVPVVKDKPELEGCQAAALAVLHTFQKKAQGLGANAVVDMVNYYKEITSVSPVDIECHVGTFSIAVTLKGTYAKVE